MCVCNPVFSPSCVSLQSSNSKRALCHCPFPPTSIPSNAGVYLVSHGTHRRLSHRDAPCSSQLFSPTGTLRNFICKPLTGKICSSSVQNPLNCSSPSFHPKKPDKGNRLAKTHFQLALLILPRYHQHPWVQNQELLPHLHISWPISLPRSAYTTPHLAFSFCHCERRFRNMRGHMVSTQLDEMKIKGLRKAIVLQPFHQRMVPPGRISFVFLLLCPSRLLPAPTTQKPPNLF